MSDHRIASPDDLARAYPNPMAPASVFKEIDHVDRRGWIVRRAGICRALSRSGTRKPS